MKAALAIILLAAVAPFLEAETPPELSALEAKYSPALAAHDELGREAYILDLAKLRFRLIAQGSDGWQAVDSKIIHLPVPHDSDSAALSKLRVGEWHSARHDYQYNLSATWRMNNAPEDTTHGTWLIKGSQYMETFATENGTSATTYTLILVDKENFIFTDGAHLFFEKRTLGKGLPIRRDERSE